MAVAPELLEMLRCPRCHATVEPSALPAAVRDQLVERYRENFRDEEPEVEQGLLCRECAVVYPVVFDIPIMLIDDVLPASVLDES